MVSFLFNLTGVKPVKVVVERVCYSRGVQSRRGPAVPAEGQKTLQILLVLTDGAVEFFVKLHIYRRSIREGIGADPAGLGDSQSGTGGPAGALPEAPHLIPSVRPRRQQRQAQCRAQMCSVCHRHPGLVVKGHGKLPSEADGLLDRVTTIELQQLVTKGFNIAIRQTPLPTFSGVGKKNI